MNRRNMTAAMVIGGAALALGQVEFRPRPALAGGWASLELINPLQVAIVGLPTVVDAQVLQHGVHPSSGFPGAIRFVHKTTGEEIIAHLAPISNEFAIVRGEFTLTAEGVYQMHTFDMGFEIELGSVEALLPASGEVISELRTDSATTPGNSDKAIAVDVETEILDNSFADPVLEVPAGTTVRWTNTSVLPHQMRFDDTSIETSAMLRQGDSFTVTFGEPGEYTYICTPHPHMTGLVRVQES
jgi:plastocyanin